MLEFIYRKGSKNKTLLMPNTFNELSANQLLDIMRTIIQARDRAVAELEACRILCDLSRISYGMLPLQVKHTLTEHVAWVFDTNTLTVNLLPSYDDLYGPANEFDNFTMKEWNACEIFYNEYTQEENALALDKLVAVLYRPAKPNYDFAKNSDGDCRLPLNINEVPYYEAKIAHWPFEIKMAILYWYDGCRNFLNDLYEVEKSNDKPEVADLFLLIRSLCGEKYGSFHEVENMNVHQVMRELQAAQQELEEFKRKNPTLS